MSDTCDYSNSEVWDGKACVLAGDFADAIAQRGKAQSRSYLSPGSSCEAAVHTQRAESEGEEEEESGFQSEVVVPG